MADLISTSNSSNLLKPFFPDREPAWTALKASKFLSELKKDTDYQGDDNAAVVVTYAGGSGVGANFATAKANMSATSEAKFALGFRQLYALCAIKGSAIARSKGSKGALVRLLDHNIKMTVEKFNRRLSAHIWSLGGGAATKLTTATTVTNTYFTCAPASDAGRFEVNDYLVLASDDGTGTNPAGVRTNRVRVTKVNVSTGRVDVDVALNTIVGAANTDYVFFDGDYGLAFTGVRGWIPIADPSAGVLFKGVDRSICVNKLSGLRKSGSGLMKLDTIRESTALAASTGCTLDRLYTNPFDFADISGELEGKGWIDLPNADPRLGHRGLRYESPAGSLIVVSEPWVPQGYGFALNLDSWILRTAGDCPMVLNEDKTGKLHRLEGDDGYEFRIGAYGELECSDPGQNMVITWA